MIDDELQKFCQFLDIEAIKDEDSDEDSISNNIEEDSEGGLQPLHVLADTDCLQALLIRPALNISHFYQHNSDWAMTPKTQATKLKNMLPKLLNVLASSVDLAKVR